MKCVVACVMTPEAAGWSVLFPDIAGGTSGETLYEALEMAEDAANGAFMSAEERGESLKVTPIEKVEVPAGAFMTLIKVDTDAYRRELKPFLTKYECGESNDEWRRIEAQA